MNKLLKYNILRHLPGRLGRRFQLRFMRLHVMREFEDAINRSAGMICIDLGAHFGKYTRAMALGAKQVIAFEPDPWAHEVLQKNVRDFENVKIENAAAGTCSRTVHLYRHARFDDDPAKYSRSSSVVSNKINVTRESAIEVNQIDFIEYVSDLNEEIGVLKIDIEGAEVELLESLLDQPDILKRIHFIFVETHASRIPSHKPLVKLLRSRAKKNNCT